MSTLAFSKTIEVLPGAAVTQPRDTQTDVPVTLKIIQTGFRALGPLFPKPAARLAFRFFSTPRVRARHKTSDALLESARIFEFLYGRRLLKGYEWGHGDKTVLLVHGWESRGTALRSFVPALLARGYRVVAFDGPAHGNSGGKRTNLPHFAGAVRAAIRQIGPVHAIITHSFGGASTVYALSHLEPEIALDKLVLIAVPNHMQRVLENAGKTLGLPKSVSNEFLHLVEDRFQAPLSEASVSNWANQLRVRAGLIVHDRYDPVVPFTTAEQIFSTWNNASLLVAEGLGHYHLMKNPDLIERVADFIHAPLE